MTGGSENMQENEPKTRNAYLAFTWNRPGKESKIFSLSKSFVAVLGVVAIMFLGTVVVGADLIYEAYGEKSELMVRRAS